MQIIITLDLKPETTWAQVQQAIAGSMPAATKLDVTPVTTLVDAYGAKGIITAIDHNQALNYLSHNTTW